jgi:hypothetical protein
LYNGLLDKLTDGMRKEEKNMTLEELVATRALKGTEIQARQFIDLVVQRVVGVGAGPGMTIGAGPEMTIGDIADMPLSPAKPIKKKTLKKMHEINQAELKQFANDALGGSDEEIANMSPELDRLSEWRTHLFRARSDLEKLEKTRDEMQQQVAPW